MLSGRATRHSSERCLWARRYLGDKNLQGFRPTFTRERYASLGRLHPTLSESNRSSYRECSPTHDVPASERRFHRVALGLLLESRIDQRPGYAWGLCCSFGYRHETCKLCGIFRRTQSQSLSQLVDQLSECLERFQSRASIHILGICSGYWEQGGIRIGRMTGTCARRSDRVS